MATMTTITMTSGRTFRANTSEAEAIRDLLKTWQPTQARMWELKTTQEGHAGLADSVWINMLNIESMHE
jgi:hypothetical protein